MSLSQGHDTIAWYIIKIQLGSDNLQPRHGFGYVCTVTMTSEIWPWVKVMTHPWVMATIVWNIIKIQPGNEELWPGQGFWVCMHCDLDLGDVTLDQGHDTPLGHGQQLCEIWSRSKLAVRS